jgi:hypothetical protein
MQIELVGCTCAGKTTLAKKMVEAGQALGIDVQLSDDFMLSCMRLNWVKQEFVRRRLIEAWAFLMCLMVILKYRKFYSLILSICFSVPGPILYRFKLVRVALKKIGIYEIIRRWSSDKQMILLDNEGVLQAAHTLFVHAGTTLHNDKNTANFFNLAPLPDAIAYLRLPEQTLIERTLKRGHNRISEASKDAEVASFISQAVAIFEEMQQCERFSDKLIVADCERQQILNGRHPKTQDVTEETARLILAGWGKMPIENKPDADKGLANRVLNVV